LLFNPFNRLPFGSLESELNGFPFFKGSFAKKMENAASPVFKRAKRRKLAKKLRPRVAIEKGIEDGRRFVRGRL